MKIKKMPFFIIGCVNITLVIILVVMIIIGIRPVSKLPSCLLCLLTGIWALTEGIETKKQRQQRDAELREMAKIYGWDNDLTEEAKH